MYHICIHTMCDSRPIVIIIIIPHFKKKTELKAMHTCTCSTTTQTHFNHKNGRAPTKWKKHTTTTAHLSFKCFVFCYSITFLVFNQRKQCKIPATRPFSYRMKIAAIRIYFISFAGVFSCCCCCSLSLCTFFFSCF